jgi:hypothetical protein
MTLIAIDSGAFWALLVLLMTIAFCFGVYIENRTTRREHEREMPGKE